ncbi:MAG: hypothetical protein KDL87_02525 [Verrucomicrobiae bacterium]|nr:hypothetical protein [Verrucomicrobiae bacterium]
MKTESQTIAAALAGAGFDATTESRLAALVVSVDLGAWFATVDDSPYTLSEWLEALASFDAWLTESGVEARPVTAMLGYLECCTMTIAPSLPLPDFSRLLRTNLEAYGFDAAQPAQR